MTIISRRDPIVVAPPGSGRTYSIVPLTFRARAAMKADLVRETGQPVFREQLQTARRSALREIGPTNLADLMALLDEIDALPAGTYPDPAQAAQLSVIDSAAMKVPAYADLIGRNYHTVYVTPFIAARHGLRGWEGPDLPVFRREQGLVPEDLLEAVPQPELEVVGWAVWNAAHVTAVQEKNSVAPSPLPGIQTPTQAP